MGAGRAFRPVQPDNCSSSSVFGLVTSAFGSHYGAPTNVAIGRLDGPAHDGAVATGDDDALYVLTAVLLTPAKFPSVLGRLPGGLRCTDPTPAMGTVSCSARTARVHGGRSSSTTSPVAVAIASWDCGMEHELSPDERTVLFRTARLLDVAVAAPGVPARTTPRPAHGSACAHPTEHRNLGDRPNDGSAADEIALQLGDLAGTDH